MIQTDIRGDAVKPTARCIRVTKCVDPGVRAEKRFLSEVLRFSLVPHHAENVPIDSVVMGAEERPVRNVSSRHRHVLLQQS